MADKAKRKYTGSKGWSELNEALMKCHDEKVLSVMLEDEGNGPARKRFMGRILSRIQKVRAARERADLEGVTS